VSEIHFVTGGTGLIGSHVVEALLRRGKRVRVLVRPDSDRTFLQSLGVDFAVGDLTHPETLPAALANVHTVYHCAARVSDWGPWEIFQKTIVDATRSLLRAAQSSNVPRFVHVSSINVYGHPKLPAGQWLTEDSPLGRDLWLWDHYCRAKILTEEMVRSGKEYAGAWTVLRPSWTYGPRDRNSMPRVIAALRRGRFRIVGTGNNRLNIIHAEDMAEGIVRAGLTEKAIGRVYNLSSEGVINQRELLEVLTQTLKIPPIQSRVSFKLAFAVGFFAECLGRLLRWDKPPLLTRYAIALIGRSTRFSIERARTELDWEPKIHPRDGVRQVLEEVLRRGNNA
jgi:nucleoside-diphosphate-sugar epimerase